MQENPIAKKLSVFMDLTDDERQVLDSWTAYPKSARARSTIIREGDPTQATCLVLNGWCARHKDLPTGGRQIVGVMLPGDLCDLHSIILKNADHSISTLSDAVVSLIPPDKIAEDLENRPRLTKALWWSTLVETALAREWVVNIGQRDATTALAHLFAELWVRARVVELVTPHGLDLPLTQTELAEALGLTSIHVNRILRSLREKGLATFRAKQLLIPDEECLLAFAGFDPSYLHLERRAGALD